MRRTVKVAQDPATTSLQPADGIAADSAEIRSRSSNRYSGTICTDRIALAMTLIEERKLRQQFLPGNILDDIGWDIILVLYLGQWENWIMTIKAVGAKIIAPKTTLQRWTIALSKLDLISRTPSAEDRRAVEVELVGAGLDAIDGYLNALHRLRT